MTKEEEKQMIENGTQDGFVPDEPNQDAVRVNNGSQHVEGNITKPNEVQISWWISQMKALSFPVDDIIKHEIFKYSTDGFEKFIVMKWRQFANFISSNWDYNDKMMEDLLDIDKYDIDTMLCQNGSIAIVKKGDNFYPLPYVALKYNIAGKPTKIQIHWNSTTDNTYNSVWDGNVFFREDELDGRHDFVIMDNDPTQWNVILKNIGWLQVEYRVMCEIYENIFSGATHWLQFTDIDWDMLQNDNAKTLNDIVTGRQKIVNFTPKVGDSEFKEDKVDSWDKWAKSLLELTGNDRLIELWQTYYNADSEAKKVFGMNVNANVDKKERQITSEITTQQDEPYAQKMAMFNKRKKAIDQANKYWKCGWEIELLDTETDEEPETDDQDSDKIGEKDSDKDE